MLRNLFGVVLAVHILGPIWSLIAAALMLAGGVGLLQLAWHLLLLVTAP